MNCNNCPYRNGNGTNTSASGRTILIHPLGNPLTLQFPIKMKSVNVTDGVTISRERNIFERLPQYELICEFSRGKKVFPLKSYVANESIVVNNVGSLGLGSYDVTIVIRSGGTSYRFKQNIILQIVDETMNGGQYDNDEVNVLASYPVIQGQTQAIIIDDSNIIISENGKFKGDDTPNDEYADINAAYGDSSIEVGEDDVIITI